MVNDSYRYNSIKFQLTDGFERSNLIFRAAILLLFLILSQKSISAQNVLSDSIEVMFRQSKSVLDPSLEDNRANLDRMVGILKERADSSEVYRLKNVYVIGSASPEGSVEINRSLSQKRAYHIFDYLGERVPLDRTLTEFVFLGRDWKGLYRLVLEDNEIPYRSEVLEILAPINGRNTFMPLESDRLLRKLKQLHKGQVYQYLYTRLFPKLRNSRLFVEYDREQPKLVTEDSIPEVEIPEMPEIEIPVENFVEDEPQIATLTCRPFFMGVKTNLLYDALMLPNIGVEFYLGKNWTVGGNWTYGWWDKNKTHWYWRAYGGDISVRKWFGSKAEDKPLTGHHLGLYAGVFTFDFELGGTGYMGGRPGHDLWNRCMYTAGVEYGYSLPIARRLNLDFTVGVGYVGGKVVKYHPKGEKYIWNSTRSFNGILPTKLEVSLVWLIGCGNKN